MEYIGVKVRQHAAQGPEVALMLQEESLYGSLRPELHGISQHLHGHLVATEIVPHKHHSFYILCRGEMHLGVMYVYSGE